MLIRVLPDIGAGVELACHGSRVGIACHDIYKACHRVCDDRGSRALPDIVIIEIQAPTWKISL